MDISRWRQPPANKQKRSRPGRGGRRGDAHERPFPPPLPGRIDLPSRYRWLTPTGYIPTSLRLYLATGSPRLSGSDPLPASPDFLNPKSYFLD
jgi:hypothetical protein